MAKKLHSFRLDPDLVAWIDNYATGVSSNRTALMEAFCGALREGRLWVVPKPNPFPGVSHPEILPVKPFPEGTVPTGTYHDPSKSIKETTS